MKIPVVKAHVGKNYIAVNNVGNINESDKAEIDEAGGGEVFY